MPTGTATPESAQRDTFLPFSPPLIGDGEKQELLDTLDSGWITKGPKTERFEQEFAAYCGVEQAVGLNSCTAALHMTLMALEIGKGDEVIVPTMTFASTAHAVMYVGAKPVFADCDASFNLAVEDLESRISTRTRAIIPVHYGGQACRMDEILDIALRHDLRVIEDAAHAAGSEYGGRKIGSLESDAACFSFYATKNMTTGEGGMVTSHNAELIERIRRLSMYGISDARRIWKRYAPRGSWQYDIAELGYKYNMMDIQAALGIHQLRRLDEFIARREHFATMYDRALGPIDVLGTPIVADGIGHARHLYPLLVEPGVLKIGRDTFIEALTDRNIGTSVLYQPLHAHSYYEDVCGHATGDFPNAMGLFERVINLPISPAMMDTDIEDVIAAVTDVVDENR